MWGICLDISLCGGTLLDRPVEFITEKREDKRIVSRFWLVGRLRFWRCRLFSAAASCFRPCHMRKI